MIVWRKLRHFKSSFPQFVFYRWTSTFNMLFWTNSINCTSSKTYFFRVSELRRIFALMLHCESNSFWCCFALGCKMTTSLFPHVCFLHTRFLHHSLYLWLPLLFKVSWRLFWSCSTAILSPLIKFTRKGTSLWLYCYLVYFLMVWFSACDGVVFAGYTVNTVCLGFLVAHRLHCNTLCLQSSQMENDIYPVTKFT